LTNLLHLTQITPFEHFVVITALLVYLTLIPVSSSAVDTAVYQ